MQGRVGNLDVALVGEKTLTMRADVPVEGEHAWLFEKYKGNPQGPLRFQASKVSGP